MSALITPPRELWKPSLWPVQPGAVDPEWRWAWDGLKVALACWEGGGGETFDLASRTQATLQNGAGWGVRPLGASVEVDGSTSLEHINLSPPFNQEAAEFTWLVLIELDAVPPDELGDVIIQYEDGTGTGRSVLYIEDVDDVLGSFISGAERKANTTLLAGNRYLVGLSVKGGIYTFWLNGETDGTFSQTPDSADGNVRIGAHKSATDQALDAGVMLVLAWNRELSATEVRRLYEDPYGPFRPAYERIIVTTVDGGQTFARSMAGSITPTGALVRQPRRIFTGMSTPAGILARRTEKTVGGSATPAGAVARQTEKTVAGASTPAGAVTRTPGKQAAGTITPTGALVRQAAKTFTGRTTPAGALARQTAKTLLGSTTPSGILSTTVVKLISVAGSITPAGALVRQVAKSISGAATPAGTLTRQAIRTLTGSTTTAGAVTRMITKTVAGSTTASGSLTTTLVGAVIDAVAAAAQGVYARAVAVGVYARMTASDILARIRLRPPQ